MQQVGIATLKARLSEFLARVKEGEEIVVTDRGRPVARLVPPGKQMADAKDGRLLDLQRRGVLRVGLGHLPDSLWEMERAEDPEGTLRAAVQSERFEGR
jgi:prevent-host-death family protein